MRDEDKTRKQLLHELATMREELAKCKRQAIRYQAASEAKNRALLDAIPDLMFSLDKEGIYLDYKADINDGFFTFPSLYLGQSISELMPLARSRQYMKALKRTLESSEPQIFEYHALAYDGSRQYFEARMARSGKDEVLVIVRNITARKKAEEERERLLMAQREQYQLAEALRQAGVAMNEVLDYEQMFDMILQQLGQVVDYDGATLLMIEEQNKFRFWRRFNDSTLNFSDFCRSGIYDYDLDDFARHSPHETHQWPPSDPKSEG